jgi:hypothetical protein
MDETYNFEVPMSYMERSHLPGERWLEQFYVALTIKAVEKISEGLNCPYRVTIETRADQRYAIVQVPLRVAQDEWLNHVPPEIKPPATLNLPSRPQAHAR